ncbi:MAG: DUF5317 domain-containing protein [Alicyclobacillus sp.]|nr:DUF5317 domain-containing protein [Alicyclobacillus sp.]
MAFQFLIIVIGLIAGWVRKGSVWNIPNIRIRLIWALPLAYILQHVAIRYLVGAPYVVGLLTSYLMLLVFCIWNYAVPGIKWALAGILSNLLVMSVNGLRMPAYIPAVKKILPWDVALLEKGMIGKSVAMSPHTHLNFLGDIFLFNIWPQSIISIGDILFAIGLAILLQSAMLSARRDSRVDAMVQGTER